MKVKYFIYMALAIGLCCSCDKWLTVDSQTIITEDDIAQYPELAEAQFLANYQKLRASVHSIGDGHLSFKQHHHDSYTDDGSSNIPWAAGVVRNYSPGNVFGSVFSQSNGESVTPVWNYQTINEINKFIDTYKDAENVDVLATVGEAYFIRAYLYFEMVKRYGGVPLFTGAIDDETSLNNRSTEKAAWDFVLEDLNKAIDLLPETQAILTEDKDRANKYTALALKSRAMLYAGTIAKYGKVINNELQGIPATAAEAYLKEAAEAANAVVKASKYTLSSNFEDLFNGKDEDNNEIIFRFANKAKTGLTVYHDYWNQNFRTKNGTYTSFMNPHLEIVEQFETLDGEIKPLDYSSAKSDVAEFFANRDKRLAATVIYPGGTFLGERYSIYKKTVVTKADGTTAEYSYANTAAMNEGGTVPGHENYTPSGVDGVFYNNSGGGTTNWGFFLKKTLYGVRKLQSYLRQENDQDAVVIRYGEVILNLAEAAVELSESYGDNSYVNDAQAAFDELRKIHGGLPPKTMDLEVVRHERRIDLLYEGFRYWDLKRWRLGEANCHNKVFSALHPVLHIDETVTPVSVYYTLEKGEAPELDTRVKWFEEKDYYSPIPVAKAPGIVQNIGW